MVPDTKVFLFNSPTKDQSDNFLIAQQQQQAIAQDQSSQTAISPDKLVSTSVPSSRKAASERLKKGLSSLLTQWNNTPFYGASVGAVPVQANNNNNNNNNGSTSGNGQTSSTPVSSVGHEESASSGGEGSSALAGMLNGSPADGLVKARVGRMTHTRPLGRPLRWG